jgi:hypothetical protein
MLFPWPIIETISGRDPRPTGRLVNWLTHWHRAIVILYLCTHNIAYFVLYCTRALAVHDISSTKCIICTSATAGWIAMQSGDRGATMGKGGGTLIHVDAHIMYIYFNILLNLPKGNAAAARAIQPQPMDERYSIACTIAVFYCTRIMVRYRRVVNRYIPFY